MRRKLVVLGALTAIGIALGLSSGAPSLAPTERMPLLLDGVTVVNPGVGRASDQRVAIGADGQIESITPIRSGAREGQFAGMFLLPGLIDSHVHLPPPHLLGQRELFAALFLAHGVTTIRDTGPLWSDPFRYGRAIRDGEVAGPRTVSCGPILDGPGGAWPGARIVSGREEARAAVRDLAAAGAVCIKTYESLDSSTLGAIARTAEELGLPVIGHLPFDSTWREAQIREIQHLCVPRCRSLRPDARDQLIETAVRAGLAHTPTLVVFEGQSRSFDYPRAIAASDTRLLPRFWREVIWNPRFGFGPPPWAQEESGVDLRYQKALVQQLRTIVGTLHARGVPIYAGSDSGNPFVVPGASLHRELELLVESGLSIEEAWVAATRAPGRALGIRDLGTIVSGAPADLLVFAADPTTDLRALATLQAVIADGRLYKKDEIESTLIRQRGHFETVLYRWESFTIARMLVHAWRWSH